MKVSGFYSVFAKYLLCILCTAWASSAFAYLKVSYDSGDLTWQSEELRFGDEDYVYYGDFFIDQTISFNVDFIIPEFSATEPTHLIFDDVISNISTSTIFTSPLITNSRFELTPDLPLYTAWSLTFDVIDNAPLANGTASGGSFSVGGLIELNPDGSGVSWGSANFLYYWNNWVYRRHDMEWILNTDVHFANFESPLTIEKISVSEPLSLGLLLTGLSLIAFTRRKTKRIS
ncbi:MAG: PEP-CTERM sorting domain-containing protein [Cellvibrio sp.]|uniref:PEP-CTERM sorting domain-containing protein n=1 Tax=Cellvibrio sp. TaxID=1965322 RepID=UPI0031A96ED9